jgi:hypothetical protein
MAITTPTTTLKLGARAGAILVAAAALVIPAHAIAGDQVPLKGSDAGTWGEGAHACGVLYPVFVSTTGTASHLGRYAYSARECVDFGTSRFSGFFEIAAADGSSISGTYAGSFTVVDGVIHYEQENTITGGSRRLAGASGAFHVSGLASLSDFSDVQLLNGTVSSIGSAK